MRTGIEFVYNEAPKPNFESYLVESVKSIRGCARFGVLDNVFILNDGSTDNSKEIILSLIKGYDNVYLIDSKKNLGKLKIFSYGLKVINEFIPFQDEDIIFTADSDMKDFQCNHVNQMAEVLEKERTDMVIANYYSGGKRSSYMDTEYSGIRAIKSHFIQGFYDETHDDFEYLKPFSNYIIPQQGYCLEKVLNLLAGRNRAMNGLPIYSLFVELDLHLRKAGKGYYNKDEILEGFEFFEKAFDSKKCGTFSWLGKLLFLNKFE